MNTEITKTVSERNKTMTTKINNIYRGHILKSEGGNSVAVFKPGSKTCDHLADNEEAAMKWVDNERKKAFANSSVAPHGLSSVVDSEMVKDISQAIYEMPYNPAGRDFVKLSEKIGTALGLQGDTHKEFVEKCCRD